MKFLCTFISTLIICSVESAIYSPLLRQTHRGPLYDGIKLLIGDEKFNAELMWNETIYQINEITQLFRQSVDQVDAHNAIIKKLLQEWTEQKDTPLYKQCFKQYEREVARFNRELLDKYQMCRQHLNSTVQNITNSTLDELAFIKNAGNAIAEVAEICGISKLKVATSNQAGIVMCVVSRIGQIDQRLLDVAQLCLDVSTAVSMTADDPIESKSCRRFQALKLQFDNIYENIQKCITT